MSFIMTCSVVVEGYKPFVISSMQWERSIDSHLDTASFKIPAMMMFGSREDGYSRIETLTKIRTGLKVSIYCGYDGNNKLRFKGFISKLIFGFPAQVFCEGYYYKLKGKLYSFQLGQPGVSSTLKELLETVIKQSETGISLSKKMTGELKIQKRTEPFKNKTAEEIFSFLREVYGVTIFFFFDEIYGGLRATFNAPIVKFRLRWNVVKDDKLQYEDYTGSIVQIEMRSRNNDGTLNKVLSTNNKTPGNIKIVKTTITDKALMQMAANEKQAEQMRYTGSITGFLEPYVEPGMTCEIIDKRYPARNGSYFVSGVQGSFGPGGGRQNIILDFYLGSGAKA